MASQNQAFHYTVKTDKYISDVQHNSAGLTYMNRQQIFNTDKSVFDAYGPLWIVGFCDIPTDRILILNNGKNHLLKGKTGFFAPAFSIIQWFIKAGTYNWTACVSNSAMPSEFSHHPFIFNWNGELPYNHTDLIHLLKNAPDKKYLEQQMKISAVAEKVKNYIDQLYTEPIHISEVAKQLNFSWSFMSREFKKVYGISPIEYRHRLRLFHAIKLLYLGASASESCFNSGFNSLTQFNAHFKQYFNISPSAYNIRKTSSNSLKSL